MGGDHGHDEPDFNFKEYPPVPQGILSKFFDSVFNVMVTPVTFVRGRHPVYHFIDDTNTSTTF
jgi:hypothetical protein